MTLTANFPNTNDIIENTSFEYAKRYFDAGYCPIPVKFRSKEPDVGKGWQKLRLREDELEDHFPARTNIGIVLGDASNGLVDIDLDTEIAVALAPMFLPPTAFLFGRKSKPASHWVYQVASSNRTIQFQTPQTSMIVEVRANGGQTVFPGSIHESRERIEFTDCPSEGLPIPTEATWETLVLGAKSIAIGSVLLEHWTQGNRHALALAISGVLARCGWTQQDVARLVQAVAELAVDDELDDRLIAVETTFDNHVQGRSVSGHLKLVDILGAETAGHIEKWIGQKPSRLRPQSANSNNCWTVSNFSNDDDMAKTFSECCRENLRYSTSTGQWYRRDVDVFDPVADATAQGVVSDFVQMSNKVFGGDERFSKTTKSRSRINATLELSRSRLDIPGELIDSDKYLVGLQDGHILDLQTKALVSGKDVFVTKRLGSKYDPSAECPRWLDFLHRIFDGNQGVIDFIQRAVGYSLTGETSEQCLFILIGTGANGKSTFLNALNSLFGGYAGVTPMQTLTAMKFSNGQTNDLAALVGKRFVSASDGEADQKLAENKIKNMTGGDKISCRALYKEYITYDPQFKLWIATNELPKVSGTDEAIWRRIKVVEFPVFIPPDDRDPNLANALSLEAPGILNWGLEGLDAWKQEGLKPPTAVLEATVNYRETNDVVGQFIEDRCELDRTVKTTAKDLYENFENWATENGSETISKEQFGKVLRQKGFQSRKKNAGTSWIGLRLTTLAKVKVGSEAL